MSLIKVQLQQNKSVPLTVEPFQTAIGIDFDCYNQKLYWSDVATRAIKMGNINGSGKGAFLDEGDFGIGYFDPTYNELLISLDLVVYTAYCRYWVSRRIEH